MTGCDKKRTLGSVGCGRVKVHSVDQVTLCVLRSLCLCPQVIKMTIRQVKTCRILVRVFIRD